MELLRALIAECLSAAAEEIFKMAERAIAEHEEEMSCSKWVADNRRRLLDVAKSRGNDVKLQSAQQQPPASITARWEEPVATWSEPTEECRSAHVTHPRTSPGAEKHRRDREILIDIDDEDDGIKREREPDARLKEATLSERPVRLAGSSPERTSARRVERHPGDESSAYQCRSCDRRFCHRSEFLIHATIHEGAKPHECRRCEKRVERRDSLFTRRQQRGEGKPRRCSSPQVDAETPLGSRASGGKLERGRDERTKAACPLTIAPYDGSEFEQESLQPLCLYQIQTVADIDKESPAALPAGHVKTEPAWARRGASGAGGTEPNRLRATKHSPPRRPAGEPTEPVARCEAGTAQKPYKCPCCAKCFSLTKTLIRHARIHAEEKPYQCRLCGRNFCQKSDLVNHTRVHTGEKPYRCRACDRSFSQKGNLVVHMRKHAV